MLSWRHRSLVSNGVLGGRDGVTLVEMAVVLIIIGLIILIVFPALMAVRSSTQQSLTNTNLQALLRATAAYVQANGCVPCPTPAGTVGTGFGVVRGATGTIAACGACNNVSTGLPEGIPPFVSLGLPAATAHDGWGRWITMRVDPALTVPFNVVPPTSPCNAGQTTCAAPFVSNKGLCSSGLATANRIQVGIPGGSSQSAAIIFVSHGSNGLGAYYAGTLSNGNNGERIPGGNTCTAGAYEKCNASNGLQFWDAPQVVGGASAYDDVMVYLDRNNLVSMLSGGGACATVW